MGKVIAIHQPDYIPWLGLYYKMAHCDTFVYLDDAQYSNQADHNVNLIKTPQGPCRLKVPVEQHLGDLICNVRTKDELKWKEKHLKTLRMNYSKAAHFHEIFPEFEDVILSHQGSIADLNMQINRFICKGFQIHPEILKSSQMDIHTFREERVIDICLQAGGTEYLSGKSIPKGRGFPGKRAEADLSGLSAHSVPPVMGRIRALHVRAGLYF